MGVAFSGVAYKFRNEKTQTAPYLDKVRWQQFDDQCFFSDSKELHWDRVRTRAQAICFDIVDGGVDNFTVDTVPAQLELWQLRLELFACVRHFRRPSL